MVGAFQLLKGFGPGGGTLRSVKGGLVIPPPSAVATVDELLLDAANEKAAFVFEAPKTGSIAKIQWATNAVTTGATVDVRLETLDRTATPAVPSGTLWGANTNGSQVVADGDDNTSFATPLTAAAAVSKGDVIAVVIVNPAGSPGNFEVGIYQAFGEVIKFPYVLHFTSAWAAISDVSGFGTAPLVSLEYSDGSYEVAFGCRPVRSAFTTTVFNNTSTPDSIGTRLQLPFPARAHGCWLALDADGPYAVKLVTTAYHQGNGTGILASRTIENEDRQGTSAGIHWRQFSVAAELAANTNYRLVVEPTSGTSLSLYDFDVPSLAALDATWGGREWHLTTAKDPTGDGDWTNYNSGTFRKFLGGLILDQLSDGLGGAVGALRPGILVPYMHPAAYQ